MPNVESEMRIAYQELFLNNKLEHQRKEELERVEKERIYKERRYVRKQKRCFRLYQIKFSRLGQLMHMYKQMSIQTCNGS